MDQLGFYTESEGHSGLTVRYRGPTVDSGMMPVDNFVPVIRGLQRTLERAAQIVDGDADGEVETVRVYITADFEQSSFEFHVALEVIEAAAATWLVGGGPQHAAETISKVFDVGSSLIDLVKKLRGAKEDDITRTSLDGGAVQYNVNVTINGNNNSLTFEVPQPVAALEQDRTIRENVEAILDPLLADKGVQEVQFLPDGATIPTIVDRKEARYFRFADEPPALDDSLHFEERVLLVVKPAFARDRRWRFRDDKGDELGAVMQDMAFQRDVGRRLILFGSGDKLHVRLAIRMHSAAAPEYFVAEVLGIIRPDEPEEPPEQMRLA